MSEYDLGAPAAPQPMSPNEAHATAAQMAEAGVPVETIREHLKARGTDPDKAIGPADAARWELHQLKRDPEFAAALEHGESEAVAEFTRLTFAMSMGEKFSPVPEVARPEDYRFNLHRVQDNEIQARLQSETAQWAADLKLPGNVAAAVMESMLDNVERTSGWSQDARVNNGEHQLAMLRNVIGKDGTDVDKALKDASEILRQQSGRTIDLAGVARTNGATVAHELVLHALALGYAAGHR